jgi:predicted secreted hydrolase
MNRRVLLRLSGAILLIVAAVVVVSSWYASRNGESVQAQVVGLPAPGGEGFARVEGPMDLEFPGDHGPHDDYQTEWWYYTGNLATVDGRQFGYQLTFFRRAILAPAERTARSSEWAANQIYLAHFTLSDISGNAFHAFERLERGAAGLAGATGESLYRVWLRDWSVEQVSAEQFILRAAQDGIALELDLTDVKGIILQGDQGYSRKGPETGNASTYYSMTRMAASGTITIQQQQYEVAGESWLDREFSTSALSAGQVGWDWFSLQLSDGSELMVYAIRRVDGTIDSFSRGAWIAADGSVRDLQKDDFQISAIGTWLSPHSNGRYPSGWQVSVPVLDLAIEVEPLLKDQELNLTFTYWEGAVEIRGERDGQAITGSGYVELTGYAQSLEGQF